MIIYESSGRPIDLLRNVTPKRGSVFPRALLFSLPVSVIASLLVNLVWNSHDLESFEDNAFMKYLRAADSVLSNNAIWGGFSFLVGFLIVFRTSQAYSRFWEGCTHMHKMGAEWFDACSCLMAFTRHSAEPPDKISAFHNMLVRLFSMLHAASLGEIEDSGAHNDKFEEILAFSMEVLDADLICDEALVEIRDSDSKVELIFQWIQMLIVENIKTGVLSVPPPILSRSFQEIANGMVHFHEAMKISNVPFPFPYAQTCDFLLLVHWLTVPFVVSQWVRYPFWAFVFCFIQVFTVWALNLIAVELENPFGLDPNDIDGAGMQMDLNRSLRQLLSTSMRPVPTLKDVDLTQDECKDRAINIRDSTFWQCWTAIDGETAPARRKSMMGKTPERGASFEIGGSRDGSLRMSRISTSSRNSDVDTEFKIPSRQLGLRGKRRSSRRDSERSVPSTPSKNSEGDADFKEPLPLQSLRENDHEGSHCDSEHSATTDSDVDAESKGPPVQQGFSLKNHASAAQRAALEQGQRSHWDSEQSVPSELPTSAPDATNGGVRSNNDSPRDRVGNNRISCTKVGISCTDSYSIIRSQDL